MYFCGSQIKQRLFPYTELNGWFLKPRYIVFSTRYGLSLRIMYIKLSKLIGHYMYHKITFNNSTFCQHGLFIYFVCIWQKKRLFPYEALSDLFYNRDILFTARYGLNWYFCFGIVLFSVRTWLGLLVADLLCRRPVFDPRSVNLRFVADKGAQWQVFTNYFGVSL